MMPFTVGAGVSVDAGGDGFSFSESSAAMMVFRSLEGSFGAEDLPMPKGGVDFFEFAEALLGTEVGGLNVGDEGS